MKSLFYITGKQATGKSRLVRQLSNSIEVNASEHKNTSDRVLKALSVHENVGVVSQIYSSSQKNDLQIMSKNEGIQFFNIKL